MAMTDLDGDEVFRQADKCSAEKKPEPDRQESILSVLGT